MTAALPAVDDLAAVVSFGAAVTLGALRSRTVPAAPWRSLAADFSAGTAATVMHLPAAIDEAAALAPSFFAGLSQTAAIVDAALVTRTAATL